jgi:hypothetical protein
MGRFGWRALAACAGLPFVLGLQCLNPGPTQTGKTVDWQRHTVNSGANVRPTVVEAADFDSDGKLDIVAGYEGAAPATAAVFIFFQVDGDNFTPVQIATGADLTTIAALAVADIDLDGHTDVVAACNGRLAYLHSPADPRQAGGWTMSAIAQSDDVGIGQWSDVAAGNIDRQDNTDLVACNSTKGWLTWFQSPVAAGSGTGWTRHNIDVSTRSRAAAVILGNISGGAGFVDVFSTAPGENEQRVAWYQNPSDPVTATSWTKSGIGNMPGSTRAAVGDLNGDGRNDIVVINDVAKQVGWYARPVTPTSTWTGYLLAQYTQPTQSPAKPVDVKIAFVGSDNQQDVIVATDQPGTLRWFTPVGTQINIWGENNIRDLAESPGRIAVQDVNGNGRPDVIVPLRATDSAQDSIAWFENPE